METKKNKYDTNPLDANEVRRTEEVWGQPEGNGAPTQKEKGVTREMGWEGSDSAGSNLYSEAPTRRYDNLHIEAPYPSVFIPPTPSVPSAYQPPVAPDLSATYRPTRTVAGIGLPEKWTMALPYAPFYI